jgi:hypothetical protein
MSDMVKLVYRHFWGGEFCSGTEIVPFEYKGKDEFVYDVLNRFNKKYFKEHECADLFGQFLYEHHINDVEHNVFTLEEWFIKEKQITFIL